MTTGEIEAHIRATPPACLQSLRVSSAELPGKADKNFKATWRLACKCGGDACRVLGYPLQDLNPDYKGQFWVGPLGFDCTKCGKVSEILDTNLHGYHAEVAKLEGGTGSTQVLGTGKRSTFLCPNCDKSVFDVAVGFVFWHFDLIEDEPELPGENFFNEFLMGCTCMKCDHVSEPTGFGKL